MILISSNGLSCEQIDLATTLLKTLETGIQLNHVFSGIHSRKDKPDKLIVEI